MPKAITVSVGEVYRDNDPRCMDRHMKIVQVLDNGAVRYVMCDALGRVLNPQRHYTSKLWRFGYLGRVGFTKVGDA